MIRVSGLGQGTPRLSLTAPSPSTSLAAPPPPPSNKRSSPFEGGDEEMNVDEKERKEDQTILDEAQAKRRRLLMEADDASAADESEYTPSAKKSAPATSRTGRPLSRQALMRPWTAEEDALLASLGEQGVSNEEIALRLDRTAGAVKRRRAPTRTDANGRATRGDRWTTEDDETITRMSAEGASTGEIADAVNRSEEAVKNRLRNPPGGKPTPPPKPARVTSIGSTRNRQPSEAALAAQALDSFFQEEPDPPVERERERSGRTTWSEEDDKKILAWREEGLAWTEIAARLDCTMSAVTGHWTKMKRRMGIEPRRSGIAQPWTKEHDQALREGRIAGESYASIAARLGRTTSSIGNRWVKKADDWIKKGLIPKIQERSPSPHPEPSPPPSPKLPAARPPAAFRLPRPPHLPPHPPGSASASTSASTSAPPLFSPGGFWARLAEESLAQPSTSRAIASSSSNLPIPSSRPAWSLPTTALSDKSTNLPPTTFPSTTSDPGPDQDQYLDPDLPFDPDLITGIPSKPYRPRRQSAPSSSFAPPATKPVFRTGRGAPMGAAANEAFVRMKREGVGLTRAGRVWVLEEEARDEEEEEEDEMGSEDG